MSGNVSEWCSDWFDPDYYKKSPSNNPTGPDSGSYRVVRGGSFMSFAALMVARETCRVQQTRKSWRRQPRSASASPDRNNTPHEY
ncbi:MAG: SUMF1/EgtB/PvdO family nonheme iron enzyme [Lewinellaceae bacterium]|nr:SUMF1/EgtB/PvdO family nonheme iron enzyme [Lewinellaceae bacterium]